VQLQLVECAFLQGSCPALESLNLSSCPSLEYVLVQSNSLTQIDLSNCGSLNKVRPARAAAFKAQ
jgi:hypothetical protein